MTENKNEETKVAYTYALLQETNEEECESWYYFLRWQGNEDNIKYLHKQLSQVEWTLMDGMSCFDLEIDFLVSEQTAKEMTKVDLNSVSFHRKFDGKLEKIDLRFKENEKNKKKIKKAFKMLGYGKIEEFIDNEDIDPEDLCSDAGSGSESESSESSESSSDSDREDRKEKKTGKLPSAVGKTGQKVPLHVLAKRKGKK